MNNVMRIRGGTPLKGSVRAQGAKNAALPVMAACLLLKGDRGRPKTLTLENVPDLYDIHTMVELLQSLGVNINNDWDDRTSKNKGRVILSVPDEINWEASEALVRKMRASSLVLGPLLARCGRVALPLPGGCSIGSRPIDLHLKGLIQMGAKVEIRNGVVYASADRLYGRRIYLDFPSVGATENLMMAAALANGETIIENIAREPEIDNLAAVLQSMGVPIEIEGTGCVRIKGLGEVQSGHERVIPDRIEACTYLLAGIMTGGEVTVTDVVPAHFDAMLAKLEEAGARFTVSNSGPDHDKHCAVTVFPVGREGRLHALSLRTMPFPGFPTDLQPQMTVALALANGISIVEESVFQARFLYADELNRMGTHIVIKGNTAIVNGIPRSSLQGATVKATDLRAGAALIIAGLAATGETRVLDMIHVWRGYEAIDEKLRSLGADVELEPEPEKSAKGHEGVEQ